jgi:hypothetical protein
VRRVEAGPLRAKVGTHLQCLTSRTKMVL